MAFLRTTGLTSRSTSTANFLNLKLPEALLALTHLQIYDNSGSPEQTRATRALSLWGGRQHRYAHFLG